MNKFYPVYKRFRRPLVFYVIGTIRTKEGKNLFNAENSN